MLRQTKLLILFLFLFDHVFAQDVSQDFENKPEFTFSLDKSLQTITKYNIIQSDSVLAEQWMYSDGKLTKIGNGKTFEYHDNYNVSSVRGKTYTKYIFDQYGNLFYQRTIDSTSRTNKNYPCPTFEFISYIYQDSLKIFSNHVMSQTTDTEEASYKYEYDNNKKLIKVFYHYMTYKPDYYVLEKQLIYNKDGLLIKTLGNPDDMLGGGSDSTIFVYNSTKKLIEENNYTHIEKETIRYFYDNIGRLKKVVSVAQYFSNKYESHYYLEY
jgi:hypothetical protein